MGGDHHYSHHHHHEKKKCCTPGTAQISAGVILIVIGVAMGLTWYFIHAIVIDDIAQYELKGNLVLSSTSSKGYEDWVEGTAQRNPNYYYYYMWNITNIDQVLASGAKPIYAEVGPYVYRYYWYNRNASFSSDGNRVAYNLIEDYVFLPSESAGDPTVDLVTNINPAYVGMIQLAGAESQLILAATVVQIGQFIEFFTTVFLDVVSSQYVPIVLDPLTQQIVQAIATQNQLSVAVAQEYFYSQWANATAVPPVMANWTNMIINQNTGISMSSAAQLFDPAQNMSLASNLTDSFFTWYYADSNPSGPEASLLCTTFSLTPTQLNAVLAWRSSSFIIKYVQPAVLDIVTQVYPSATWSDVGWLQFVNETFTDGQGVGQQYPDYFPQYAAGPIELGALLDELSITDQFSISQIKGLLVGPNGILNSLENFAVFGALAQNFSADDAPFLELWGITHAYASDFLAYMGVTGQVYTSPLVLGWVNSGSGLITTQTVDFWLWRCNDPLLNFLTGPSACGLQNNDTVQPVSEIWTGNDNITKINTYTYWRNQSYVDYWATPVKVSGATDNGQFAPGVTANQTLYVWDENFIKTLTFNQNGNYEVSGINTYIYIMDEGSFEQSILYTNTITGFANESASSQGVPIFLSNWDFYGADPKYGNLSGMNPDVSDLTTLYVEPTTGTTIKANMKVQINLYFQPGDAARLDVTTNWTKIADDYMFPLLKVWQNSTVGSQDSDKLKTLLMLEGQPFNEGILWGVVGLGFVLAVVGFITLFFGYKNRQKYGYQTIQ